MANPDKVILDIGQSNMVGQEAGAGYSAIPSGSQLWRPDLSDTWKTDWTEPSNYFRDTTCGASMLPVLAKTIIDKIGGTVGFVRAAENGRGLANVGGSPRYWSNRLTDPTDLYGYAVRQINTIGKCDYVVCYGGEADQQNNMSTATVKAAILAIESNFRADCACMATTKFIWIVPHVDPYSSFTFSNVNAVKDAFAQLDDEGASRYIIYSPPLLATIDGDVVHKNKASQDLLGKIVGNTILYHLGQSAYWSPGKFGSAVWDNAGKTIVRAKVISSNNISGAGSSIDLYDNSGKLTTTKSIAGKNVLFTMASAPATPAEVYLENGFLDGAIDKTSPIINDDAIGAPINPTKSRLYVTDKETAVIFPSSFSGYLKRQKITMATNTGAITDFVFPYLKSSTTEKCLPDTIFSEAKTTGADITFGIGNVELDRSVVLFDVIGEDYRFDIRIPSYLSGQEIYCYWGNASANKAAINTAAIRTDFKLWAPGIGASALTDISQYANNSTSVLGSPVFGNTQGVGHPAIALDELQDAVNIPDADSLSNPSAFEVMFVYKTLAGAAKLTRDYIGKGDTASSYEWLVFQNGVNVSFQLCNPTASANKYRTAPFDPTTAGLKMLNFTWDGTTPKIYLNATQADDAGGTAGGFTNITAGTGKFVIGKNPANISNAQIGFYSSIFFSSAILTDNERTALKKCLIDEDWTMGSVEANAGNRTGQSRLGIGFPRIGL